MLGREKRGRAEDKRRVLGVRTAAIRGEARGELGKEISRMDKADLGLARSQGVPAKRLDARRGMLRTEGDGEPSCASLRGTRLAELGDKGPRRGWPPIMSISLFCASFMARARCNLLYLRRKSKARMRAAHRAIAAIIIDKDFGFASI